MPFINYEPSEEPSYFGNIKICVTQFSGEEGSKIEVDELFNVVTYTVSNSGRFHPKLTLNFKLVIGLEPSIPLDTRFKRMRELLNDDKPITLRIPPFRLLYVLPSKVGWDKKKGEFLFSTNLIPVPPPERAKFDDIYAALQKVKDAIAEFQDFADDIANEAAALVILAENVLATQALFIEPFKSLSTVVSTPFAIAKRAEQLVLGLAGMGKSAFDSLLEGLTFDFGSSDNHIFVPVGGITRCFRRFSKINIEDKVGATFACACMFAMVREHIRSDHKTKADIEDGSNLLSEVEDDIRNFLPDQVLDKYRDVRNSFDQMIKEGAFNLENQITISAGIRKPVIISYYEELGTVEGFYNIENYNFIRDYLFGERNDQLIFGIS